MGPRARVAIAGILLLANGSAACTSWRVQTVTPQELLAREHPEEIRIRERGGAVYVLRDPRLEGDSLVGNMMNLERRVLVGYAEKFAAVHHVARRVALNVRDTARIESMSTRQSNDAKTLFWVVIFPMAALLGIYGIGCASGAGGGCSSIAPSWQIH